MWKDDPADQPRNMPSLVTIFTDSCYFLMDSENSDQTKQLSAHADLSLLGTQFICLAMFWVTVFC